MDILQNIFHFLLSIGGYAFLFGGLILWPLMWPITGRYFDNHVGLKKINNYYADSSFILPRGFIRTCQYATLIVFHRGAKKSIDRDIFGDMDFREKARAIDKILAFSFVVIFYGGLLLAGIAAALAGLIKLFS